MDRKLLEIIQGKEENYLYPFYWQHGNHTEKIPDQIQSIYDSGCRAFCVESRPHPEFCGEGWWRDMDIILSEAKKRDMKVWVLDDDLYPTGHAAGLIEKKYPHLRQTELIERHIDVVGPAKDFSIIHEVKEGDVFIGAYAYRRNADYDQTCKYEAIDLTDHIKGHYLYWDIPEGVWRIFFYFKSQRPIRQGYIDMISRESVHVLIEAVYEPHYEHYKDYFGNTLVGFFSDEPCLGNQVFAPERFDFGFYEAKIGKHSLALPWNDEVLERMTKKLGYDPVPHLNLLWYSDDANGDDQCELRYAYMDTIMNLYSECFNKQLGNWCRDHGVIYTGHIIEDMNCHMRGGVGHYFRAIQHQDISGIDIVLHQVMPGMDDYLHTATPATGTAGGDFYHYILAKLGSSMAHIEPRMKGRAMCEVFGAFGWGEDTTFMKYLIDHLFVRGINYFVPHAFDSIYPDIDCPPHFGIEGKDPSFEGFGALMRYTNKVAHLLNDTTHKANAAILYHMEAEWASRFDNAMNMQPAATRLHDNHIDYDIIPMDYLKDREVKDGKLIVNKEHYDCLIVPYADHMSAELQGVLRALKEQGLEIFFLQALPENLTFDATVVAVDELIPTMKRLGMTDVEFEEGFAKVRTYHCTRDGNDIFMFVNEDYSKVADTTVKVKCCGDYARLDLLNDICTSGHCDNGEIRLNLLPNQSQIIVFGDKAGFEDERELVETLEIAPEFDLEIADYTNMSEFTHNGHYTSFFNVTSPDFMPDFSGKMRYTFKLNVDKKHKHTTIDLGRVGQNVELVVNGKKCGMRITAPYAFDITDAIQDGENVFEATVSNTLVQIHRDYFSLYLQLAPSGLLGDMSIKYYN
jgi:hypothetical protein